MYLNLAAAWKELVQHLEDAEMPDGTIGLIRGSFYGGAREALCIQRNIVEMHEGEAATILLEALMNEALDFVREAREAVEAME